VAVDLHAYDRHTFTACMHIYMRCMCKVVAHVIADLMPADAALVGKYAAAACCACCYCCCYCCGVCCCASALRRAPTSRTADGILLITECYGDPACLNGGKQKQRSNYCTCGGLRGDLARTAGANAVSLHVVLTFG
jgi:hypothetical protein